MISPVIPFDRISRTKVYVSRFTILVAPLVSWGKVTCFRKTEAEPPKVRITRSNYNVYIIFFKVERNGEKFIITLRMRERRHLIFKGIANDFQNIFFNKICKP